MTNRPVRALSVAVLAFLASCSTPNPQPALQSAALAQKAFVDFADGTEAMVRRSNPPSATLDAYLQAAATSRRAFQQAYDALLASIGSMGQLTPEQATAAANQILDLLVSAKQKLHP